MSIKIQSGLWKGRFLKAPPTGLARPSSSLLKKAFFDIFDVEGALFADLFAGSGAVGIEALSRGAKKAVFVEKNPQCLKVLTENLNSLNVDKALFEVIRADALSIIEKLSRYKPLDHIFLDPPYDLSSEDLYLLLQDLWPLLSEGGFIHLEQSKQTIKYWEMALLQGQASLPIRMYGDTLLISWQKI